MDAEDICVWPNGDWCYGEDLELWLRDHSDDYSVLKFDSDEHRRFCKLEGLI